MFRTENALVGCVGAERFSASRSHLQSAAMGGAVNGDPLKAVKAPVLGSMAETLDGCDSYRYCQSKAVDELAAGMNLQVAQWLGPSWERRIVTAANAPVVGSMPKTYEMVIPGNAGHPNRELAREIGLHLRHAQAEGASAPPARVRRYSDLSKRHKSAGQAGPGPRIGIFPSHPPPDLRRNPDSKRRTGNPVLPRGPRWSS